MGYVRGACALGLVLAGGCAAIAGLDHTYERDEGSGGSGAGGPGGSTSSATSTGSTTSGSGAGGAGGAGGSGGQGGAGGIDCSDPDKDGDTYASIACSGTDCDDGNEDVSPAQTNYFDKPMRCR